MEELIKFLNNHRTEINENITHQSLPPQSGKYCIKNNELKIFHRLYYQCINNNQKLYLIEKLPDISPIHIDLDFRFNKHFNEHKYKESHIYKFLSCYLSILKKNLVINDSDDTLSLVYEIAGPVIEKKNNNEIYKDGIHIIFPKIICNKEVQKIVRTEVLIHFNKLFPQEEIDYINDADNIIDLSVIQSNGWIMYGSRKQDREPYELTKILKEVNDTLIPNDINNYSLEDTISLSSIRNKNDLTEVRDDMKDKLKQNEIVQVDINYNNTLLKDIENIKNLLECLLPFRYDEYKYWIELGFILFNISNGKPEYFNLWDEISKKSDKYDKNSCKRQWKKFKSQIDGLGIGTLKMWAKKDNKKKYINIIFKEKELYDLLDNCFNTTHDYGIAALIGYFYRNEFIYVNNDSKNSQWYHFENHYWKSIGREPLSLSNIISDELPKLFDKFKVLELEKIKNTNNLEQKTELTKRYQISFKNLKNKIQNNTPKKKIIDEAKIFFRNEEFDKIKDTKNHLVGFYNGVYDTNTHVFRNGCPDDYITMTVGYKKIDYNYKKDKEIYDKIINFFNTIHPSKQKGDKERREYLQKTLSQSIRGLNTDEKLYIWSGEGGNGKTKLLELHNKSLGDYSGKLSSTYITNNRKNSGDASPDIINVRNCRFVSAQEPDADAKINNGIFKEISGGDQMTARGLFSNPITFTPQFQFVLMCNDIPQLQNAHDKGVFRRLVIVKFLVEFTNDNRKDEYVAKPDRSLIEKMKDWMPYYMNLLIEWNKQFFKSILCEECKNNDATHGIDLENDFVMVNDDIKNHLKWCSKCAIKHNGIDLKYNKFEITIPEIVKNDTNDYKRSNDAWFPFFENYNVKQTGNEKDFIDLKALLIEFKQWCQSDGQIKNIPNLTDFNRYISKCYLKYKDNKNFYDKKTKLKKWKIIKI